MMQLDPKWEFVSDTVMGGVSSGTVTKEITEAREATVLRGEVSLENNGGFVQTELDVSAWEGLEVAVWGNGDTYDIRLRTAQLAKPWQSFRADFVSEPKWRSVKIPFTSLTAHRVDAAFDPLCLRRIGILAIGHEGEALIAVSSIGFYTST